MSHTSRSPFARKIVASLAALAIGAGGLTACSSASENAAGKTELNKEIRIGSTDSSSLAWKAFEKKAQEAGIKIKVVNFSDYNTPNQALAEGQIDVNQFQHLLFLANYNNNNQGTLTPIDATFIVPLALYWKDHKDLTGIEGQSITIPNDPTNQGRAINVLVQAGLVQLKDNKNQLTPKPTDVDAAASKVKLTPVDAAQTAAAWGEGKPAIINNNFLTRAHIDPLTRVFADDPNSPQAEPYINAFVTTKDKKADPQLLKLAELWHSPEVTAAEKEDSDGTLVPVQKSAADLEKILSRVEQDLKTQK